MTEHREIRLPLEDLVSVLVDLNEMVVSLDRIGSRAGAGTADLWTLGRYVDDGDLARRLSRSRGVLSRVLDEQLSESENEEINDRCERGGYYAIPDERGPFAALDLRGVPAEVGAEIAELSAGLIASVHALAEPARDETHRLHSHLRALDRLGHRTRGTLSALVRAYAGEGGSVATLATVLGIEYEDAAELWASVLAADPGSDERWATGEPSNE